MKKICLLSSVFCLLLSSCSPLFVQDKRIFLGTTVEIKAVGRDREELQKKIDLAFVEIDKLEKIFNFHNPQSELSRLNKNASQQSIKVSKDLFFVIEKAIEFAVISRGAFDPTVNSLSKNVCYKDIVLNKNKKTIFFTKRGLRIDLGGCAKGYIVDQAAKKLRQLGIESFLINAGGDIVTAGKEWKIGIQHPQKRNRFLQVLKLKDKAVASSGNYLRSHIINPFSKQVAQNNILSSTIISDSCLKSDILSTAVFVLGRDKGLKLIKNLKDVQGMIAVKQDGKIKVIQSMGFNENE